MRRTEVVDLTARADAAAGKGVAWSQASEDLNVNLVVFEGDGVDEHVNAEVDVLVLGIAGEGMVTIDGQNHALEAGRAVVIPKGARRAIRSTTGRFAYVTCHRRRPGLWPARQNQRDLTS
jgi:quercetin dioxygenase-like cupin family protein